MAVKTLSTNKYSQQRLNSTNIVPVSAYVVTITPAPSSIDYLVVAGGGGGGQYNAGGGGAGGLLTNTGTTIDSTTTYVVTIGGGGVGGAGGSGGSGVAGSNGINSSLTGTSITPIIAVGGGGGGAYSAAPATSGGSGGGGGTWAGLAAGGSGTAGPPRQGYDGGGLTGASNSPPYAGSGGGGAGAPGVSGNPGAGGAGTYTSFISTTLATSAAVGQVSSSTVYFAGGGGGGGNSAFAVGGIGGGGSGSLTTGAPGTAFTGGGGGAGGGTNSGPGGQGGSGVVIIRHLTSYATAVTTGNPTVGAVSGNTVYIFTASGTIKFLASSSSNIPPAPTWPISIVSGTAVNTQLTSTGTSVLTYTLLAGNSLPAGVTLSTSGLLSGTASVGTYTFSVSATDAVAQSVTQLITLNVSVNPITGMSISSLYVTDNSYTALTPTRTAVSTSGGYVSIIGTGFAPTNKVYIQGIPATTSTYVSATQINAQLPAYNTSTQNAQQIYVVNTLTNSAGILITGFLYSIMPYWTISSSQTLNGTAITTSLAALSDSVLTYSLYSGTLPGGLTLNTSTGVISGTVSADTSTSIVILATDAETQTNTQTFTISIIVSDPYFKYTTLLLAGNGTNLAQNNTFLDSSTNNFAITRAGNTTQSTFTPFGANWSLYTNGSSSYAYLPYSATRAIGTGDFSIECWVYIARQPANYTRVWSHQSNYGLAGSIGVELAFGTVDTLIQTLVDGNSQSYASATYDTTGSSGSGHVRQWIHVVSSRQNGYLRLFVNGILREAQANSTNINGTSNTSFGTNSQLGGDLTELYMSNFRMCIGSVPTLYSTTSITAGTTIFTPPTAPVTTTSQGATGVQLLLFQDNRIIDRSSNAFAVTTVNNPRIQRFSPFSPGAVYSASTIGGSAYFDGSGDYLLNTGTTAGQLGSGNFTFECWYYPTNATFGTGGANTAAGIFFDSRATAPDANGLSFYTMTNGTVSIYTNGGVIFTSSNALKAFAWNHIAFVRSGSTITIYINGVSGGTVTSSVNFSSGRLQISGPVDYAAGYIELVGYVCDHRVVKGTAVYTGTFTPPTEPLTAITNTSLLLNYTNAGIIDNTMQNNLETVGDAKISTAVSKFGGSSMYFDGTGDYCFLPNTHSFLFSKGDFTIEAWVYISDTSTRKYILGPGTDPASHYKGFGLEIWNQQLSMWASSNGTSWDILECDTASNRGATLLAINTWYHIAVSRSGSTFRSFVNGVVEKTFTSSATIFTDATIPYNIGRSGYSTGGYFYYNGYIDDLRITRGYARYTTTFTPPAAPLPAQ
jgi:hypothetical protein